MSDEQSTPSSGGGLNFAAAVEAARRRLLAARRLHQLTFTDETDPVPEPSIDQIWRARWERTATAVLLLGNPDNGHVRVAVVTFDPGLADTNATVTPARGTTIGTPAVLWLDTAQSIPLATLDAHLGDIRAHSPRRPQAPDEIKHFRQELPRRVDDGVMRASVIDDLSALASASWLPETGGDITELLTGVRNSQLAEVLDVSTADALQIKRGQRPLQHDEAVRLAPLIRRSVEELVAAANPLPPTVIELFNSPAVRVRVTKLARSTGADEITTRREAAYGVFAAAARTTGREAASGLFAAAAASVSGRSPNVERDEWRQRIAQYFDTRLPKEN